MAVRDNPYAAFNFVVTIDGIEDQIGFMECTGLDNENTPMEYRDNIVPGGEGAFVRKLPGMERYPNLVLKRGLTGSTLLWDWRKQVRDGEPFDTITRQVSVSLQDEKHTEVYKWVLVKAWPVKLSGPSLNAKGNELAIETLELAYERLDDITSP